MPDKTAHAATYFPARIKLVRQTLSTSSLQCSTQNHELCFSKSRSCSQHLFAVHNITALVFGVGPQDDSEGGRLGCEVCLDVLKELASGQIVLIAGAGMDNERVPLLPVTLQTMKQC